MVSPIIAHTHVRRAPAQEALVRILAALYISFRQLQFIWRINPANSALVNVREACTKKMYRFSQGFSRLLLTEPGKEWRLHSGRSPDRALKLGIIFSYPSETHLGWIHLKTSNLGFLLLLNPVCIKHTKHKLFCI